MYGYLFLISLSIKLTLSVAKFNLRYVTLQICTDFENVIRQKKMHILNTFTGNVQIIVCVLKQNYSVFINVQ